MCIQLMKAPTANAARNSRPPPPGYICKICGDATHWINECPQGK